MLYTSVIIIPCYNEYARLPMDSFIDHLKLHPQHACCFVNDGSTDKTLQLLHQIQQTCTNAYVVNIEKNQGKAAAVYNGIQYAIQHIPAQNFGYLDADLATPLSFIEIMEKEMQQHSQLWMVFGSRQIADKSTIERKAFRHYSGRLVSSIITWALKKKYGDTQCGAKLFSKQGVENLFTQPFQSSWVFDVEIIKRILVKVGIDQAGTVIKEIPVNQWKDVGNSKVSSWYVFKMIGELLSIKRITSK